LPSQNNRKDIIMKKNLTILVAGVILLAGCGTYQGYGAANGAYFGSLLGSAIGGISGGPRGSDVGTLVGLAGGAVVGAAIGNAADNARKDDMAQYQQEKQRLAAKRAQRQNNGSSNRSYGQYDSDDSGFDATNSADDRIDIDFGDASNPEEKSGCGTASLIVRNVKFTDPDGNYTLTAGEQGDISFEIYNSGDGAAYNVEPVVKEVSGNKRIMVSPGILVESLAAHKGLRYTAHVMAYKTLKDGMAKFSISVLVNKQKVTTEASLWVRTSR
jgi:outer membrane lipoprotein SlyB